MRRLALAVAMLLTLAPAHAQDPQGAEHEALRKLKADVLAAINARKLDQIDPLLHKPFMATVVTQESFNDANALKGWFEGLFTRNIPRVTIQRSYALGKPKGGPVQAVARNLPKSETRRVYDAVIKRYWWHAWWFIPHSLVRGGIDKVHSAIEVTPA